MTIIVGQMSTCFKENIPSKLSCNINPSQPLLNESELERHNSEIFTMSELF